MASRTYCGVEKATCGLHMQMIALVLIAVLVGGILFIAVQVWQKANTILTSGATTMQNAASMSTDFKERQYDLMMANVQSTLATTGSETVRNLTLSVDKLMNTINSNGTDIQGSVEVIRGLVTHLDSTLKNINRQGGLFGDMKLRFAVPITFLSQNTDGHDTDDHTSLGLTMP